MSKEEAERWLEERRFEWMYWEKPEKIETVPADDFNGPSLRKTPGQSGWWVAGWKFFAPRDKEEVRIHEIGETLPEAVEKAIQKWNESV